MKKMIIVFFIIILIPYLVVYIFIKEDKIKFSVITNKIVRVKREKTNTIEKIPFEEYIVGVLAGEMPAYFPEEALKAQAVAARSYVSKHIKNDREYDVVDSTNDQVYLDNDYLKNKWGNNYEKNINKIRKAVIDTKGEVLTYNNEIINAFFFSTSNGKTENSEEVFSEKLPYLKSVDSSWDINVSPVYTDEKIMSLDEFYNRLSLHYDENLNIFVKKYTESGSVKEIIINDNTFKGTDVRFKPGLRSSYFTIQKVNKNVKIITKGFGHGVGMSQYGALAMAKLGYKYDQILKHYYTNVEIQKK